jgi:phage terminase small subunit
MTRPSDGEKRRRFAAEYVVDLAPGPAAIRAGYSRKTAAQQGCKLLRNRVVQAEIARLQAEKFARAALTADMVLEEFRRIAFSNVQQLFRPDGALIPLHELPPEVAAAIASMEVVMKNATAGDGKIDRVLKVKWWDKNKALTDLARHFGLLVDRVEITGVSSLMEKIEAARERGAKLAAERDRVH